MTDLQIFNFNGADIRTLTIDGEPYFVGKDVAEILGYAIPTKAVTDHVDKEDRKTEILNTTELFQNGNNVKESQAPQNRTNVKKSQKFQNGNNVKKSQSSQNATGYQNIDLITESGVYSLIFASKLPTAKKFKHWVTSEVLPAIRKHGGYLTDKKIEEALYNPDTLIKLATQLKEEREGRLIAEQQVAELKPKASYLDEILENKELITVSVIAKDYGMSAMEFNKLLHNLKVQFKQGKNWLLYSSYQSLGWTSSSTNQVTKKDGSTMNVMNTKWTQKGRLGLYELLKRHDILPMIERVE